MWASGMPRQDADKGWLAAIPDHRPSEGLQNGVRPEVTLMYQVLKILLLQPLWRFGLCSSVVQYTDCRLACLSAERLSKSGFESY